MKRVNIYLEPKNHGVRMKHGACGWVTEFITSAGVPVTRTGIAVENDTTGNRIVLLAFNQAVGILKEPCSIVVFTHSAYLEGLCSGWLLEWEKNNWQKRNGERLKNVDLLTVLFMHLEEGHRLEFEIRDKHIYSQWMKGEMRTCL